MGHDYIDFNVHDHSGAYDSSLDVYGGNDARRATNADTPTPESDSMPEFTKFVLEVGDIYTNWNVCKVNANYRQEKYRQQKVSEFIAKYFCTKFANVLRKEFRLK